MNDSRPSEQHHIACQYQVTGGLEPCDCQGAAGEPGTQSETAPPGGSSQESRTGSSLAGARARQIDGGSLSSNLVVALRMLAERLDDAIPTLKPTESCSDALICDGAADEIERLTRQWEVAEVGKVYAENERLRAALGEIAAMPDSADVEEGYLQKIAREALRGADGIKPLTGGCPKHGAYIGVCRPCAEEHGGAVETFSTLCQCGLPSPAPGYICQGCGRRAENGKE